MIHSSRILRLSRLASLAIFVLGASSLAPAARTAPRDARDDTSKTFPEYGLTLTFPAEFTDLAEAKAQNDQVKGDWRAKLGDARVSIYLFVLPSEEFGFAEPEDVSDITLFNMQQPESEDPSFGFEKTLLVPGPYGFAPYAAIGYGPVHKKDGTAITGTMLVMGGILKAHGYALEVHVTPALPDNDVKLIVDFFKKGVAYKGDTRVNKWTDEEAKARWMRDAPPVAQKKFEPIYRTEHYIILSDSSGAKDFGKKMEECYAAIRKVYPFEEVPGRKLMPVFLFRTDDEYFDYYVNVAKKSKDEARKSKGHSWHDYYATWFEATGDPVHIHEGTHQIFSNRLRLGGGGSWLQEGVAEYMSTKPNDRNVTARLVKTKKHLPLAELIKVQSLLFSPKKNDAKGGDEASDQYLEAAFFIEFLRESKWSKDKFQAAIHALGDAAPNNVPAIERAFHATLGTDVAGVEAQWIEYAKTRH
jgi:hypothetical protein